MSAHTPSIDGAGCADSCVTCALARARELDALRDLRALVLRIEELRPPRALVLTRGEWARVVDAARQAVKP